MTYWPRILMAAIAVLVLFFWSATHAEEHPFPGIDGTITFFYYEDLEAAERFYKDLLQLPITMNEDWIRIFKITSSSSVGLVKHGRGFHEVSDDKPAMLSMVTNDVDAWYARLQAANVLMRSELPPPDEENEPGTAPVRGFIAEDPGGYTIEFFSWENTAALEQQVNGLWLYTGLTTSDGTDMPLTGIFLFKNGVFVQQAVFDGGSFDDAGSMAHAGPYRAEPATGSVHLVAEQTISIAPTDTPALSFRRDTEHDVTVGRNGDDLTLIFGMGTSTIQEFTYVGPGQGELYKLDNGALAFVDGYFILVDGDEDGVTTGYGTFEKQGESLSLNVIRWSEADSSKNSNLKDTVINATFDGHSFKLEDGRSFQIM